METRLVAGDSSAHQEAIKFFTKVVEMKLQKQSQIEVKYLQGYLGQANQNIRTLLKAPYKNKLLSFFLDHPEAFAIHGENVCLAKMTPPPTGGSLVPSRASKKTSMTTETELNFAEEAAIGFLAGTVRYRGPLSLDRLAGHCSQMSPEMRDFLDSRKGTSAVKTIKDVLSSRPHIFDISTDRTVSIVSQLPCINEAEEKGLESMCRCVIGSKHLNLDALLNKLQQRCNHLVHMVLNEVSQDGLNKFLLTRRVRFFMPELQNVWNITAADRLPQETERKMVKFFKQEITCRGKGVHYADLLQESAKSNVVMKNKFKDSVQLAKILWCHDSELDFNRGMVLTIGSKTTHTLWQLSPPVGRQNASEKAFRLYGPYLSDYKGVISFASKHTMLIQATVEDGDGVETFEVYGHCELFGVGNGTDPKADLCQFLKGDKVIFSAILCNDSVDSENPNKLLWSAIRVTKVLNEGPDPPDHPCSVKNPAKGPIKKRNKSISQPNIEKASLKHVSEATSPFVSTGIVTIVNKNGGVLQIDRPSGAKNVYFELSKVESDASSGLCQVQVGSRVQVEFENDEQPLPEATRVCLISNLQPPSQHEATPGGSRRPLAAVKPSHACQVEHRPVTSNSVEVAATIRDPPSLYAAANKSGVSSRTSSRESLAVSSNPDIDLNHLNVSDVENSVLNVFSRAGQTVPNLDGLLGDIQNRLVAAISKELLAIAADHATMSRARRNSDHQTDETGAMVSVACQTLSTGPIGGATFTDS